MMDADCKTDSLLAADDPAVFDVFDAAGDAVAGGGGDAVDAAGAPVIVCCDHAGLQVPKRLGDLGLAAAAFDTHIAGDIGAREVSEILARRMRAPLLLANYSRLVIDLNRHLDDPTLIPTVSDGVEIPGNMNLTAAQRQQRIDELFTPYHAAYRALVDDLQARFARPLIVAVHSFAPRMRGQTESRPWDFGVLWNEQREVAQQLIANLRAVGRDGGDDGRDLCIGDNQPYHANAPRGYAMDAHAQARGVDMALIEIRQDHVAHANGQRRAADILQRALAPLLNHAPAAQRTRRVAGGSAN